MLLKEKTKSFAQIKILEILMVVFSNCPIRWATKFHISAPDSMDSLMDSQRLLKKLRG